MRRTPRPGCFSAQLAGCLLAPAHPPARAPLVAQLWFEAFETYGKIVCAHHRPGLSVDDLTADPDFDWVAKWTQVVPQLAQAFNFVMMATVRATASKTVRNYRMMFRLDF